MARTSTWTFKLVGLACAVCLTCLFLEGAYRIYHAVVYQTPLWYGVDDLGRDPTLEDRLNPIALDPVLGWRSASNYRYDGLEHDRDGSAYTVHVSLLANGFRVFGNPSTNRPKVLVIGDSYTQAVQVSDEDTYYNQLGQEIGAEMFAYGAGGFGTLQEEMLLDQYVDTIKPDVIVWQYCSNDFINNSLELERASYRNNNHLVRPYLEGDDIVYALPSPDPLGLRTFWGLRSRVVYALLVRWDAFDAQRHASESVEVAIERSGLDHPGFRRSVDTTTRLMGRVARRAGGRPIVAFNCDQTEPFATALEQVSAANGVQFWPDVAAAVASAEAQGQSVRVSDGHWNRLGHRIVAVALESHVRSALGLSAD